jgi:hypothetical protein
VLLLAVIALSPTQTAAEPGGSTKYVMVYFSRHTIGGDFTGDRTLSSVNGEFAVPSVNDGNGFGLAIGGHTRIVGLELGYWRSSHTATWMDQTSDATHQVAGLEGRFYPVQVGGIRPFISSGVFMEWLTADNAYCSTISTGSCRERFNGFGLSLGGGAEARLTGRFFVIGQAQYRHSQYDSIKALDISDGTLSYTLDGGGWSFKTGVGMDL